MVAGMRGVFLEKILPQPFAPYNSLTARAKDSKDGGAPVVPGCASNESRVW